MKNKEYFILVYKSYLPEISQFLRTTIKILTISPIFSPV